MKVEEEYAKKIKMRKLSIRLETSKGKRFWKWVWFYITYPFVWLFYNIRDWRTFLIFAICFIVISCEVWIPYLIGVICWANEPLRITMFSVGSACLLFWNVVPCTPFLGITIGATILVKSLFNKIFRRKEK